MKKPSRRNLASESEIERMRAEIDEIDAALLKLIASRKDVAIEIAKIKQKIGSEDDEERLREVLEKVRKEAEELGLNGEEVKELWKAMVGYMIKEQMKKYPY